MKTRQVKIENNQAGEPTRQCPFRIKHMKVGGGLCSSCRCNADRFALQEYKEKINALNWNRDAFLKQNPGHEIPMWMQEQYNAEVEYYVRITREYVMCTWPFKKRM